MGKTLADLTQDAADEIRAWHLTPDDGSRTARLRRFANILADMRELCDDPQGRGPDYAGMSVGYRRALQTAYRLVGGEIPDDDLKRLKSQARYHMSTIIRERLADGPSGLLREYGYKEKSVRETAAERIRARRALVDAGVIDDADVNSLGYAARLVHGARHLMDLAAEEGIDEADGEAREFIRGHVREMVSQVPDLVQDHSKIHMSRELLAATKRSTLRRLPKDAKEEVDDSLTDIMEYASRLREQTTTADRVISDIDDLLNRFESREHRRAQ